MARRHDSGQSSHERVPVVDTADAVRNGFFAFPVRREAMRDRQQFVSIGVAAIRLGCSRTTVGRLIDRGVLPAFSVSTDRRMRLVDVNDLAKLATPQPITSTAQAASP